MADGMPLPWPFPWSHPTPVSTLAAIRTAALIDVEPSETGSSDQPFALAVHAAAEKLSEEFGTPIDQIKSVELYLIQAIGVSGPSPKAIDAEVNSVIYPPEFLFVLDAGLEHLIGGSVIWDAVGYGDPIFPWKKQIALRSVTERSHRGLVYPGVAGSLIIGLVEGVDFNLVHRKLADFGLKDVSGSGFFVTARCAPFQEASICKALEATFDFVKYAEMNNIVRINDFAPGWSLVRLT